ncbi:hypothetical protein [Stenotrophomonas maltophilia]|nr:hypothetical protein [Stenotrophomonas maltophilia]
MRRSRSWKTDGHRLIAVLLIEVLLLVLCAPFFFRTGIVLFNQRIAAAPAELAQL